MQNVGLCELSQAVLPPERVWSFSRWCQTRGIRCGISPTSQNSSPAPGISLGFLVFLCDSHNFSPIPGIFPPPQFPGFFHDTQNFSLIFRISPDSQNFSDSHNVSPILRISLIPIISSQFPESLILVISPQFLGYLCDFWNFSPIFRISPRFPGSLQSPSFPGDSPKLSPIPGTPPLVPGLSGGGPGAGPAGIGVPDPRRADGARLILLAEEGPPRPRDLSGMFFPAGKPS